MSSNVTSVKHDEVPRGITADDNELLTPYEVAAWLRISYPTLNRWRYRGYGPKWIEFAPKKMLYRAGSVRAWLAEREAGSINSLA